MKLFLVGVLIFAAGAAQASDDERECTNMHYPGVAAPQSRTQRIAQELVAKAGLDKEILVCMLDYQQTIFPVMGTRILHDGRLSFVVSEDFECDASEEGLRGLIGHEVAHYIVKDADHPGIGEFLDDAQRNTFESRVDHGAIQLVGYATIRAGLEECRRLGDLSVRHWLEHFRKEMDERLRLLL